MKTLITTAYTAALVLSGVSYAKADNEYLTPKINSVTLCKIGAEMFKQGVSPDELVEILNETKKMHVEDKLIIVNCYFEERAKV